jgi:hypothetical protein
MYKNFNITESEKEEILNRLKENGYGQPINEQNAPIKKPIAPQQQSIDNRDLSGKPLIGKPDPKLIESINFLKEYIQVYLSGVETYVSKTRMDYGVFVNNNMVNGINTNKNPLDFQISFMKIRGGYYDLIKVQVVINHDTFNDNPGGGKSIVQQLCESRDLNELLQNLNKYKPEVYARQEISYGRKELVISTYANTMFTGTVDQMLNMFENKEEDIKVFEATYPGFKKNVWNTHEYNKFTTIQKMVKDGTFNQQVKDNYRKEDLEIKKLLGMSPDQDNYIEPQAQGQRPATAPQPAIKKPLNEGQEILVDVFKTLIN